LLAFAFAAQHSKCFVLKVSIAGAQRVELCPQRPL
jgi:hypothetical protein